MSNAFDKIILEWQGDEYVIDAHRVMGAIARIEDVITLGDLYNYTQRGSAPAAKLCMAYAAVLRYAGAKVVDEDVYSMCFESGDNAEKLMQSVMALMNIMLPKKARERLKKEVDKEMKKEGEQEGN